MPRRLMIPGHSVGEPIRLVIVESRAVLGVGIREILDREPDFEIVAQVQTPHEAMPVINGFAPDVILVEVAPEASEAQAVRRMHHLAPGSALVVLGGRNDDDDASILEAMVVGATAHVAGLANPSELVATIRRVAEGDDPLEQELIARPDLVERVLDSLRDTIHSNRPPANPLTARELEILALVALGLRNREIAQTLAIGEQTIKNYVSSVLHKFGVPGRTQAVEYAVRHGWLVLRDGENKRAIDVAHL